MCKEKDSDIQKSNQLSDCRVIEKTSEYEVVKSGEYTFKFLNPKAEGAEFMAQNTGSENTDNDDFDILSLDLDEKEHENEVKDNDDFVQAEDENMLPLPAMSGDALIANLARIHPDKLPFLRAMLEHGPELLPNAECAPGIIEGLIYEYVIKMIKGSVAPRKDSAILMIKGIWERSQK